PIPESRLIFSRMVKNRAFHVAEMAGMYAIAMKAKADPFPFAVLPIFPSRRFRHGFVYVNVSAGIEEPKDLEGRRVGITEYRNTASIWIRGILESDYGVDLGSIHWVT